MDWVKKNALADIQSELNIVLGKPITVLMEEDASENMEPLPIMDPMHLAPAPVAKPVLRPVEDSFNPKYNFENFVVGPSNRFAHAAAMAVAKDPGHSYNPLFLYGGVGLGKTHILHAIANALKKNRPQARVLYVTSEKFINEFIDALRFDRMKDFRSKYRSLDCLLIDDIQSLIGKDNSQEEFFYTFNSLYDARKQIVITSDRPPSETKLSQRLMSRFGAGVTADIQPPDLETRIAILRKKATEERVFVPEDVTLYIAGHIRSNIRELEGSLIRTMAYSSLTGVPLSMDSARQTLKDVVAHFNETRPIAIEDIQECVAEHFHLDIKDMKSRRRTDAVAFPRQVAMYLSRTLTDCSTTEIGERFGGKDHTTVMHACNKIKTKMTSDPYFTALINKITQQIKNQLPLDDMRAVG